MNVLPSLAVFLTLTGVLILVRFRWPSFSAQARSLMIAMACMVSLAVGIAAALKWYTVYPWLNAALYTASVVSYEFFVILFTRLRPRWLTTITAVILLVPLLSASVFLPMSRLGNGSTATVDLGSGFFSERVLWGSGAPQTSGTDLTIYYRPAWLPFMQKRRLSARYYGGQCNAWVAYAALQPDHRSALMVCPPSQGQPMESGHKIILPFEP